MIHPSYRKQGMFVSLGRRLYDALEKQAGLHIVWGFPNESSLPGVTRRLGWYIVQTPPNWIGLTHPLALFFPFLLPPRPISGPEGKSVSLPKAPAGIRITPLSGFGSDVDRLWENSRPKGGLIQIRDSRYLNWRYLYQGAFGYRLFGVVEEGNFSGYIVLRMIRIFGLRVSVLMDIFPLPLSNPEITAAVLKWARRYSLLNGSAFMVGLMPRRFYPVLRKAGFMKVPNRFSPKKWILGFRDTRPFSASLQQPESWHILCGDTDIV
jgi:hypothetical protein